MTLLLNLIGCRGIHQSSDFRLTDVATRRSIEDEFGSKQLHCMARTWSGQISFTGVAQIGQRKTRDWILDSLGCAAAEPVDAAMAGLATRAAVELQGLPKRDWFLTIVVTVIEGGRATRLFVVSSVDRPGKPPLGQPLDHFEVHECSIERPQVLIFGCVRSVAKSDRKLLKKLNRGTKDPAEIRRSLARVNARSAGRSGGVVSEGCLVSSTTPDGKSASENFGRTPGMTPDMAGSAEMLEIVTKALKGNRPTVVQVRGATAAEGVKELTLDPVKPSGGPMIVKTRAGTGVSFVVDSNGNTFRAAPGPPGANAIDQDAEWAKFEDGKVAGPARGITFSSTSQSVTFNGPDGSKYGSMEIVGLTGDAVVMKNRVTKITLGTVTVHALPAFKHEPQAMKTYWELRSVPTLNGAQPHHWGYTVDMVLDASGGTISIRQNAAALRSTKFASLESCLTETEELVIMSSTCPALMKISKDQPSASASIEARLLPRDIPKPSSAAEFTPTR